MKIISWNINGIRAIQNKGFKEILEALDADIICLQETKAQVEQVHTALDGAYGYHVHANSAVRKGYSGVALLMKQAPLVVTHGIGNELHDQEGRVITAEFPGFFVVGVYVPNSGEELARLEYRKTWDNEFLAYLKQLELRKPVIALGDFNVAHQAIDIARPKANYNKSAGYTQVEIDGFSNFIEQGFIDTFRRFNPDTIAYSWWSFRANARVKNIGWRIDYVLTSKLLVDQVNRAFILPEVAGSDHCPVGIELVV